MQALPDTRYSILDTLRVSASLCLLPSPKPSFLPPVKALLLTEYKKMSYVDVADPVGERGRRGERVRPVAEEQLVDDPAQHHLQRTDAEGQQPAQHRHRRHPERLPLQRLRDRGEAEREGQVDHEDAGGDNRARHQSAYVDDLWAHHADHHRGGHREHEDEEGRAQPGEVTGPRRLGEQSPGGDDHAHADPRQRRPRERAPVGRAPLLVGPPGVEQQRDD